MPRELRDRFDATLLGLQPSSLFRIKLIMIISQDIWNVSTGVTLVRSGNEVTLTWQVAQRLL